MEYMENIMGISQDLCKWVLDGPHVFNRLKIVSAVHNYKKQAGQNVNAVRVTIDLQI